MKRFDIVTIFPQIFASYFGESILKRAQEQQLIEIRTHNLRDYADNKHHNVDDTPYGGGAGMVMSVQPFYDCLKKIKAEPGMENLKTRTILFSAKGKRFTQEDARRLTEYDRLIMLCGRYEGIDERVVENLVDEEISIGDFVLTGGEIPAMLVTDSVARLLPGVLGNPKSLEQESFSMPAHLLRQSADSARSESLGEIEDFEEIREYPQYTKPEEFQGWKVPEVLLSGNHAEIEKWRKEKSKFKRQKTKENK